MHIFQYAIPSNFPGLTPPDLLILCHFTIKFLDPPLVELRPGNVMEYINIFMEKSWKCHGIWFPKQTYAVYNCS